MTRVAVAVLGVNVVLLLLGFGVLYQLTQDPGVVDPAALTGRTSPQLAQLLQADVATAAYVWWGTVVAALALGTALWLFSAQRRPAATPQQARGAFGPWVLGLLIAAILWGIAGYVFATNPSVSPDWWPGPVIAGTIAAFVCWWLTTALGVKRVLTPSVPFAHLLPR